MRTAFRFALIAALSASFSCGGDGATSTAKPDAGSGKGKDEQAATAAGHTSETTHDSGSTDAGHSSAANSGGAAGMQASTKAAGAGGSSGADKSGAGGGPAANASAGKSAAVGGNGSEAGHASAAGASGAADSGGAGMSAAAGHGGHAGSANAGSSGASGETGSDTIGAGGASSEELCTEAEFTSDCGSNCAFPPDSVDCETVCDNLLPACEQDCAACLGMKFTRTACLLQCAALKGLTCGNRLLGCAGANVTCDGALSCIKSKR